MHKLYTIIWYDVIWYDVDCINKIPLETLHTVFNFLHFTIFSATKRLSLLSTHIPSGKCIMQLLMKLRNCPSWFRMWMPFFNRPIARIRLWLSVVMPTGRISPLLIDCLPLYVKRNCPAWSTTTTALPQKSATHVLVFTNGL